MKTLVCLEIKVIFAILCILFNLINSYEPDFDVYEVTTQPQIYEQNASTFHQKLETIYYHRQILQARCVARCDDLLTKKMKPLLSPRDIYRRTCESWECHLCDLGCKYGSYNSTCYNSCHNASISHSTLFSICEESCLYRSKLDDQNSIFNETHNYAGTHKPEIICQRHDGPNIIVELFWPLELNVIKKSLGFVIQVQSKNLSRLDQWMDAGITKSNAVSITLEPNEEFKFKVTAVNSDGMFEEVSTDWFTTMSAKLNLLPPENFTVYKQFGFTSKAAEVEISWNPPKNKPCFYNIYGLAINSTSSSYQEKSIINPEELLKPIKLAGLSYSTWYEIRVSSALRGDENLESAYSTFKLLTKSCLELNNFNFSICGPTPPENVQVNIFSDKNTCEVSWQSPRNTTSSNRVLKYKIRISEEFYKGAINLVPEELFVNGNVSSIELSLPKLHYTSYQVSVLAVSVGGLSAPASKIISLKNIGDSVNHTQNWVAWFSSAIGFVLSSLCIAVIVYRIRKMEGGRFFRCSLPYKPPKVNSWISPLKKKLLKECPYHLDLNMICLKEVLGSGAFGIVRKGTAMIRGVEVTVAVKMLKESATSEAESSLLEEIEMLKLLGHHPHIVTLQGYAISSPQIALLVEFCPLGDLKKYLDKLREAIATEHGESGFFSASGRSNSTPTLSSCEGLNKDSYENSRNCGETIALSTGKYETRINNIHGFMNVKLEHILKVSCVHNDNYDPIYVPIEAIKWQENAKKFVSFARQISIGMDFLAKNKVIHRDLAARNILLFSEDQVKITDFGLSKDIYECGVYSKTSHGMLPLKWMALESIIRQTYTSKSDVWSFGILLWEIITFGCTPYPGYSNREVLPLLEAGYRMEKPSYLPKEIYAIMSSCWLENQHDRPNFERIKLSLEKVLEGFETYCAAG